MNPLGLLIIAFAGVCYLSVALPASGRVARRGLVGLRTPATRRSDDAWLAAHRAALPITSVVTAAAALAGVVVALGWPRPDLPHGAVAAVVCVTAAGLVVAALVGVQAARATAQPGSSGR